MKGFVPTPPYLVDAMVAKLFSAHKPRARDTLLDPGCGTGAFIEGVLRWCEEHRCPVPQIVGIDSDAKLLEVARATLRGVPQVRLTHEDFLARRTQTFDFIVGNPPYVPITGLTLDERSRYRALYQAARGRFDLYLLFFEQALDLLNPNGRLVFVTPEKFLYVQTARPLRQRLAQNDIEEIELVDESVFGELVTYPTVTTITGVAAKGLTRIKLRDGSRRSVRIDGAAGSWLPLIRGSGVAAAGPILADAFVRISCGVATGADSVYVIADSELPASLRPFAHPTVSGRRLALGERVVTAHSMLVPYARNGALLAERDLGALRDYLKFPMRRERLLQRTCVDRKPWYSFHETPPLRDILRPKILCKDIGARPWFVVDEIGEIVPRHSVYYLVPKNPADLHALCAYLNSQSSVNWLMAHCQRASNGFIRLQSHVLKRMPLPPRFLGGSQLEVALDLGAA